MEKNKYITSFRYQWKRLWNCIFCRILFFIVVLIIVLIVLVNPLLDSFVKPRILQAINKPGKVSVSIDDLSFNIFNNTLIAEKVSFSINDSLSKNSNLVKFNIKEIELEGINWFGFTFNSGLSLNSLVINHTDAVFKRNLVQTKVRNKKETQSTGIANFLPSMLKPFSIKNIIINSFILRKNTKGKDLLIDSLGFAEVSFNDMRIDSTVLKDSLPLKFARSAKIFIKDLKYHFLNDYLLKIDSLNVVTSDSIINAKEISFKPYISDTEFFSHRKYRTDLYNIESSSLSVKGIDFNEFVWRNGIIAESINFKDMYLSILTNKTVPFDSSSIPKMPNEILRSSERKINIENLSVNKMKLYVRGKQPKVERYSEVYFSNVNADISNISNIPSKQNDKEKCIIKISSYLYGAGKLSLTMKIPLLSDNLSLSYEGQLGSMKVAPLNRQLETADKTKLTSGKIDSVDFTVDIFKGIARSYAVPIYEDLEIKVLEEDATEGGLSEGVSTFIANAFAIRSSNPNESGEVKNGSVVYIKKKGDTFMDVVWSALKKALGDVVGF